MFKVGQTVVLKSGGPLMTIIKQDNDGFVYARYWRASAEEFITTNFPEAALRLQEPLTIKVKVGA